jgi:hypothetical protein
LMTSGLNGSFLFPTIFFLRLSALMDLYIHPLYVLVSKILSYILNSPAPIHDIILYSLWDPLITLSKHIHVWSSFEGFIESNLMVQSKFNLDFFVCEL